MARCSLSVAGSDMAGAVRIDMPVPYEFGREHLKSTEAQGMLQGAREMPARRERRSAAGG